MADIATLPEFASALQTDVDTATASLLLLDLAQGLITAEIGTQNPWPTIAKSTALTAAGRAYRNPEGIKSASIDDYRVEHRADEMGVYLTDAELTRLHRWLNGPGGGTGGGPLGSFPGARDWPDPLEAEVPTS